jgi:hypothetical protein
MHPIGAGLGHRAEPPPDIVVAGAPKTGTTAVTEQLRHHPQVHVPALNEPRFFYSGPDCAGPLSTEFNEPRVTDGEAFASLYADAGTRMTVDSSTDYLSQPQSADRLAARRPDAKVVIGLRHPATRAFSEHVHLLREGAESETFARALELEAERIDQRWVPLFHHAARSTYGPGLRAFTERFDTLVYHHEDLRADPAATAARLTAFLGLASPLAVAPTVNTAGVPRAAAVNRILRPRGPMLRAGRHLARRVLGPSRLADIRGRVDSWNLATPTAPDRETVDGFLQAQEPDIAAVEEILGTNLDRWRAVPPEWT